MNISSINRKEYQRDASMTDIHSFSTFLTETIYCRTLDERCYETIQVRENLADQTDADVRLLKFFLRQRQPKKILEVGVFEGGGTLHLFDELGKSAELYSVDVATELTLPEPSGGHRVLKVGHLAIKAYDPDNHPVWKTYFGQDVSQCLEKIGGDIDFVILDTTHSLPGELLSYMVLLPYLSELSVVMIHDISLHKFEVLGQSARVKEMRYSPPILFNSLCSENKYVSGDAIPLMGAVALNKSRALRQIPELFNMLFIPWEYVLPEPIEKHTAAMFEKHYPDLARDFRECCAWQKSLFLEQRHHSFAVPGVTRCDDNERATPSWAATLANSMTFNIDTREAFQNALQNVANTHFDYSLRHWPTTIYLPKLSRNVDCTPSEYEQRQMELICRTIMSPEEYAAFKDDVPGEQWQARYQQQLITRHEQWVMTQARALDGMEVWFLGAGSAYEHYRGVFSATRPKGILVTDTVSFSTARTIDGLRVMDATEALTATPHVPVIVFSRSSHMNTLLAWLTFHVPSIPCRNIIPCRFFQPC